MCGEGKSSSQLYSSFEETVKGVMAEGLGCRA